MQANTSAPRRLGIMGGTFDPVHRGHLIVAELIRSRLGLETVVFVPSHCPPHKKIDEITPAEHGYAMVPDAVRDYILTDGLYRQ